jgi:hypothetical protein
MRAAHPACYPTTTEGSLDVIKVTAKSESDERLKLKGSSITTLLHTSLCSAQAHGQLNLLAQELFFLILAHPVYKM